MRRGVRLGIDPGQARIGVARSDAEGLLAVPVETVPAKHLAAAVDRLVSLVAEYEAVEVWVGLPLRLQGDEGAAAVGARRLAGEVAERLAVPVRLIDERLTTVSASRSLRDAGRTSRSSKRVVDQAAAVVLLQAALDGERVDGRPPGELVVTGREEEGPA